MRVTSAGNVGIGTTSPFTPLEISSASNTQIRAVTTDATGASVAGLLLDQQGTGASTFIVRAGGNYSVLGTTTNTPVLFAVNNAERARIDSSGRLLVGTSAARSNFYNLTNITPFVQYEGASSDSLRSTSQVYGNAGNAGPYHVLAKHRGATTGLYTVVAANDELGVIDFQGADGAEFVSGVRIVAEVDGTPGANNMPGRLVFSTTANGAASPTERMSITSAGVLRVADAGNIAVGTTTGTKIGTATTQKLGFYNATPVVQPAAVANATTAVDVITQLNDLLAKLRTLGIIAT